ncbi:UDP-2,3-diacylglucosamine diphosphatase [Roseateles violae]|uniref:UDP-2,3-diacylglucosamine hydrolase n=1 Tax=Roseateles violae TaxID=3058042 RepID=A0ABT8DUR3_9BURK|nr:UDP-2,3-diacylglucosamine diphosphatase [Pelomonas sp. PFR6]MDN3922029.1 UDP-2,3-diacylglucosamine diphosphatase [Pelomonas sp. PFR6]
MLPDAAAAGPAALPQFAELRAPADWRRIDLLSDLHLSPDTPATFEALARHLGETAAEAVFLLGDIFEVWVGDDARHDPFEAQCVALLRTASRRLQLFFMAGNRDFLVGPDMLADCGMQGLADPTVLNAFGQRWLLTHGDALCLEDTAYQAFRAQVRSPAWQAALLAKPLAERREIGRQMRAASQAQQADQELWADLDAEACRQWLRAAGCAAMIHGHTHRPREHDLGDGLKRHVLSDWDFEAEPPRGDLLRLRRAGLRRIALA